MALAAGDDDDLAMDRGPAKNGLMDARCQRALGREEISLRKYTGVAHL